MLSIDRVCVLCGEDRGVDDMLEEGRPVHAHCVFLGRSKVVRTYLWMGNSSLYLKSDSELQFVYGMMQKAKDVRTFRHALESVCRYLLEFKERIETEIASYEAQRAIDNQEKHRLSIMERAVKKICVAFKVLQVIAEEYLLDRFDPARFLGRPIAERQFSLDPPEEALIAV